MNFADRLNRITEAFRIYRARDSAEDGGEKTGPKTGSSRSTSRTAKLLSLAVGETIWIEEEPVNAGPTRIERDVQTRMIRSPALSGRRFTTQRLYAVAPDKSRVMFLCGITRTE